MNYRETEFSGKEAGPESLAEKVVRRLESRKKTFAAAESCTAGLVADLAARIPGASRTLWGSYVTYTEEAKREMLGLSGELLREYGAVSRETACAMAEAALEKSGADFALAVTGLAGPGGDGSGLPVGTVWIAWAEKGREPGASVFRFQGSRNEVRLAAAEEALGGILRLVE